MSRKGGNHEACVGKGLFTGEEEKRPAIVRLGVVQACWAFSGLAMGRPIGPNVGLCWAKIKGPKKRLNGPRPNKINMINTRQYLNE